MSIGSLVYQNITRRFSTLFLAASFGAFFMNYTFDALTDAYWDKVAIIPANKRANQSRVVCTNGGKGVQFQK
ncbi:hypothetical protein COOONC_07202 [Cooperia oncophora]